MNNYDQNKLKVCIQRKYDIIWQEANKCFHDMYIPGSKDLYPYLVYQIQGLKPEQLYNMTLHFERSDESRWEGRGDKYYPSGPSNAPLMSNTVWHELGPRSGKFWMTQGCSFIYLKVTSKIDSVPPPNTISLHLFHKYIPVLSIYLWPNNKSMRFPPATFRIAHTEFLAAPCPTKNERLSMLTTIRRKKNFTIREKIRSDGRDRPTVYATCRIEHYLPRAQEISTEPLWSTVSRYPYLLETSKSDCSIHDKGSGVSSEMDQECPIFQVEVDSNSYIHDGKDSDISDDSSSFGPDSDQESPILQVENTDSFLHDKDLDISSETDQECPILQVEDYDAGEPPANDFTMPVLQMNLEFGENQGTIKIEEPESPQTESRHQPDNDAGEPTVNGFTSPLPQVNMESGENQERIKIENAESPPQTVSRHVPDNDADEPHVNCFTSPVPQVNMEAGENQRRMKVENPDSPQTDSRHHKAIMEAGENQARIKIENPESAVADSRHPPDHVVGEPSLVPHSTMETEVTLRRIKLEDPRSPQTDSRHQLVNCFQDTVSCDSVVNGCTSPILKKKRKVGKNEDRIKIENPELLQIDSRHQPVNVVSEPPMDEFTSPVLQMKRKSGENEEGIEIENPESPQTDFRHPPDYVVGEPPVLQKKRRTEEVGSHHSGSHHLPVFPYGFFPQRQPIQAPNYANFLHFGMQPNLDHQAFYSRFNSFMMPNYQNFHSLNQQVFPSANGFPLPHPLMPTYPRPLYPTTFNYPAYQNMPPNYQFPIDFQVPMFPLTNGSNPFYQPNPVNSAWWNIPNPGRSF